VIVSARVTFFNSFCHCSVPCNWCDNRDYVLGYFEIKLLVKWLTVFILGSCLLSEILRWIMNQQDISTGNLFSPFILNFVSALNCLIEILTLWSVREDWSHSPEVPELLWVRTHLGISCDPLNEMSTKDSFMNPVQNMLIYEQLTKLAYLKQPGPKLKFWKTVKIYCNAML